MLLGKDGPSEFDQFLPQWGRKVKNQRDDLLYWCHSGLGLFWHKELQMEITICGEQMLKQLPQICGTEYKKTYFSDFTIQ